MPSLLATLKSPAKQNKLLLLSRNNTLISPSKQRISCSCCSDSAACSEQQEENKEEEVREEGRGGSPALTYPLLLVLLPQPHTSCSSGALGLDLVLVLGSIHNPGVASRAATALPASSLSPGPPAESVLEDPASFYQLVCTIHSHGSTRH